MHGSEASAFTLFHQLRVSSKAGTLGRKELRFQGNERERVSKILSSSSLSSLEESVLEFPLVYLTFYSACWKVYCEEEVAISVYSW